MEIVDTVKKHKVASIVAGILILGGIGYATGAGDTDDDDRSNTSAAAGPSVTPEPVVTEVTPTVEATPKVEEPPDETVAQRNARDTAQSYLDYSAFSRSGLIDQLEYEGYETSDAEYAVDALNVDWSEQASLSAEAYLDYSAFSRTGLIEQLEFEGFTHEQAVYGVDQAGL